MYLHIIYYPNFKAYRLAESATSEYEDDTEFPHEILQSRKFANNSTRSMAVTWILMQVKASKFHLLPGNRYFKELINLYDYQLVRPQEIEDPETELNKPRTVVVCWGDCYYSVLYSELTNEAIEYRNGQVMFEMSTPKYTVLNNSKGYFFTEEEMSPDYIVYLYETNGEV